MDGVLVIRKEKGYTSHDVVAKLRGILHMKKIGHTGTLDPDAEGVLPVVLGRATKLVDLLTEKRKTYEALLHLGIEFQLTTSRRGRQQFVTKSMDINHRFHNKSHNKSLFFALIILCLSIFH